MSTTATKAKTKPAPKALTITERRNAIALLEGRRDKARETAAKLNKEIAAEKKALARQEKAGPKKANGHEEER